MLCELPNKRGLGDNDYSIETIITKTSSQGLNKNLEKLTDISQSKTDMVANETHFGNYLSSISI